MLVEIPEEPDSSSSPECRALTISSHRRDMGNQLDMDMQLDADFTIGNLQTELEAVPATNSVAK